MPNNNSPEELLNQVTALINQKDLGSIVELYEPEASFIDQSGENINGRENIRKKLKGFLEMNGKLESVVKKIFPAGNIVLAYSDWTFNALGPDDTSIKLGGTALDVIRRQSDDTWLVVIDNPWGIEQR